MCINSRSKSMNNYEDIAISQKPDFMKGPKLR